MTLHTLCLYVLVDLKRSLSNRILESNDGPIHKKMKKWTVKSPFRWIYWINWIDAEHGDDLFCDIIREDVTKKVMRTIDSTSLFWILKKTIDRDNPGIFQHLWQFPARHQMLTEDVYKLLQEKARQAMPFHYSLHTLDNM